MWRTVCRIALQCAFIRLLAVGQSFPATDLRLPPNLRPLVNTALASPPEFAANALLRIVESGKVDDKPARMELIERAFRLATSAHEPYRKAALSGVIQDYRGSIQANAYGLQLDRVSLQTRAVRQMLALDKKAARELFLEIPRPAIAPLTCDDTLGPDLSDLYKTLALVASQTFSPAEERHDDHISLLLDYVATVSSPLQLAPAAELIRTANVNAAQRQLLGAKFAAAMETVQPDDRSFAGVTAALTPLITSDMMPSFQRFIAGHASAQRCPAGVQPAITAGMVGGGQPAADAPADFKRMSQDEMNLMFTSGQMVTAAERGTAAWQQRLQDFLTQLAGWTQASDGSPAAFYHQKMYLYMGLLDVTSGDVRSGIVDQMLQFASQSDLENNEPEEWFYDLSVADQRTRYGPVPGREVLDGFERTGDPALVLASALDRTLGH